MCDSHSPTFPHLPTVTPMGLRVGSTTKCALRVHVTCALHTPTPPTANLTICSPHPHCRPVRLPAPSYTLLP
ncbi:unnamed protein product [Mesocestoides corti]|uniref:Uncharacterized protein n=1 Tax=Mesocestoides corti TaxID=53468 RepID=A0A0R3U7F1_MESCO|nr:unnamed protein product [Mesocestoides corti]